MWKIKSNTFKPNGWTDLKRFFSFVLREHRPKNRLQVRNIKGCCKKWPFFLTLLNLVHFFLYYYYYHDCFSLNVHGATEHNRGLPITITWLINATDDKTRALICLTQTAFALLITFNKVFVHSKPISMWTRAARTNTRTNKAFGVWLMRRIHHLQPTWLHSRSARLRGWLFSVPQARRTTAKVTARTTICPSYRNTSTLITAHHRALIYCTYC